MDMDIDIRLISEFVKYVTKTIAERQKMLEYRSSVCLYQTWHDA